MTAIKAISITSHVADQINTRNWHYVPYVNWKWNACFVNNLYLP